MWRAHDSSFLFVGLHITQCVDLRTAVLYTLFFGLHILHIGHNWTLPVIEAHAQACPCLSPKFKLAQIQIQIQIQYKYNMLR